MALLGLLAALGLGVAQADDGAPPSNTDGQTAPVAPVAEVTPPGSDPWASPDVAAPRMDARPLVRTPSVRDRARPASDSTKSAGNWLRTTASLAGVVGLIALLGWGYRKAAGGNLRLAGRGRYPGLIEVVSRASLSPRQSVCLVRVGSRLVLLGCTPDSVRALDVIQDPDLTARLLGQAAQVRPDSQTAEFARVLENEARTFPDSQEPFATAAPVADDSRLSAVKAGLQSVLARVKATVS